MITDKEKKMEETMKKIAFFDTKPYDKIWFDKFNDEFEIDYFEGKLTPKTCKLVRDYDGVVAFVNDDIDKTVINTMYNEKVPVLAMRCSGYNNVDMKAAQGKIRILRVPAYSPYAVAEHAMALILTLNRKIHKAYIRTRDFNFSLNRLIGFDIHGKTIGVIGTGQIGRVFIDVCRGFGANVLAYDKYPSKDSGINYVELETLFRESDIISLHCPLTKETHHIINKDSIAMMKQGVYLINTSRGSLIESQSLLDGLTSGKVGAAGLDVYEEESDLFYEDFSNIVIKDDILSILVSRPNVIITSHQAFLTEEALKGIASVTLSNLKEYFQTGTCANEITFGTTQ
jgi:D-lactate dehydrogenase